ncbi:MAG: hypothetical protein ABI356_01795 [Steroidobacteraceae bacterium]
MLIQFTQRERLRARRSRRNAEAFILSAMLVSPMGAYAAGDAATASIFSLSGFGTLGLVHSSEDSADFTASPLAPDGPGFTQAWSPDVDSRLGAQVMARFTPQLSAMLQVISEQRYNDTYTPHVEWANIAYQPTPEVNLRLGRIVLPTFLLSDSRKVGYANPWVRPPVEVYSLSPIFDSDGADVSYKVHLGEIVNTVVGTYGQTDFGFPHGGRFPVKRLRVIADTVEYGPATLHLAYQASTYNYNTLDPLFDAFRQFGPQGIALANKYDLDDKPAQVITAGALYDPGNWFVTGEWGQRRLNSAVGQAAAWYVSGGYRLSKFTPYLTYSRSTADTNTSDPGLSLSGLPPSVAGAAAGLNAALNSLLGTLAVQKTISLGSRWDVMENVDVKVQYDHINLGAGSAGTLINVQPDFQRGGTVNVASIAIDFVW